VAAQIVRDWVWLCQGQRVYNRQMARDAFHGAVRTALEKDAWQVTDDPLRIVIGQDFMLVDLAAERLLLAQKGTEFIAVEVKGLSQTSTINQFHSVVGQYLNYRLALKVKLPQYKLYLAVPQETFETFYQREFTQMVLAEFNIAILVYDVENEVIVGEHP
jgi:XisH protein